MNRWLVMAVVGLAACAEEQAPVEGVPYLLTQQQISRTVINKALAPNVMVLADTSSAMAGARLTQLQTAMATVLSSGDATHARWALTTFPSPATVVAFSPDTGPDQDSVLAAKTNEVNNALQSLTTNGTTDTLAALQFVGALAGLNADDNRPDVVVLLTGGAPDGDPQATIDAIAALRAKHVDTIVVAFSPEPGNEATFDAMARAGGGVHGCGIGACGANQTCGDDGVCSRAFFDETNATALFDPLKPSINPLWSSDPCQFQLSVPSEYVSVRLDGVALFPSYNTYELQGSQLSLTGASCERVRNATVRDPATIEIRVVQKQ